MDKPVQNDRLKDRQENGKTKGARYYYDSRDLSHVIARLMLSLFFILSFFEPYLNNAIGSVLKYYLIVVIGAVILLYRKMKLRWYHYAILGWSVLKLLSALWATDHTIMNSMIVSHLGMTLLFLVVTGFCSDKKLNNDLMFSTMIGGFAIGFLSIFSHRAYEGFASRQVLVLFGYDNDPNNQAAFLVLSMAAVAYFVIHNREKNKLPHYLCYLAIVAVNAYSLMMTGSRAGIVAVIALVVYVILFGGKMNSASSVLKKLLLIIVLAVIGYVIIRIYLPEDIYQRLFDLSDYEGGSGRSNIWRNAWELVWSDMNFVFGAGWGSYWGYNGMTRAMHNTFLSVFCDTGIVGFALLTVPFFYAFFVFHKRRMVGLGCIFLATFVSIFFLEAINKRFFWNALILMLLYYNTVVDGERTAASASPAAKQPSGADTPAREEKQNAQ